jgi:glucose/mannose-6-phosphate isomerase
MQRKCIVYCISSGGTLLKFAEKLNVPYLKVPGGMPPRAALPHLFVPLLKCIEKMGFASKVAEELSETTELLQKLSEINAPENPAKDNFTKTLALNLNGTTPVIYGFGVYRSVAMRWKQQLNENSKIPAKWEVFSELNHNEIVGWENPKELAKGYATVFIRDKAEPIEIRSRIETTQIIMKPTLSKMIEVWAQGKSNLAKMLSTVLMGDFTSVYLAVLRKVDPTPVQTISLLKEKLERNRIKEKIIRELEKLAAN